MRLVDEDDSPRRIQYVEPKNEKHQWKEAVYSKENIALMKARGMVDAQVFCLQAAEQLGLTLPVYGCDAEVIDALNRHHALAEKLRRESTSGYYFVATNPRILLEDGTHIWGDECWWKPVDERVQDEKLAELLERSNQQVTAFCGLLAAVAESVAKENT